MPSWPARSPGREGSVTRATNIAGGVVSVTAGETRLSVTAPQRGIAAMKLVTFCRPGRCLAGREVDEKENGMKSIKLVAVLASILAFAAAAPRASSNSSSSPVAEAMTCHEECRVNCVQLYPNNPYMQNLCTWSCIDQECGGGPFPVQ